MSVVPSPPLSKTGLLVLAGGLWLALLGGGAAFMLRHEFTAGSAGHAPLEWPSASRLWRMPGQATLVMFAHPKCPCTRASMEDLAALMAENPARVTAHVLFLKPENSGDDWTHNALWRFAADTPGVTVSADEAGAEARRFGSDTSGDVLLYDASGRLAFHGGITAARGHSGANAGSTALAVLLAGNLTPQTRSPVFGCPLKAPPAACPALP